MAIAQLLRGIDDEAAVKHSASRNDTPMYLSFAQAAVKLQLQTVVDLGLPAEIRGWSDQIVNPTELIRIDVIEPGDRVRAGSRLARRIRKAGATVNWNAPIGLKSPGSTARLSVTMKLKYEGRYHAAFNPSRGNSSC
jgi:hypothetical protein